MGGVRPPRGRRSETERVRHLGFREKVRVFRVRDRQGQRGAKERDSTPPQRPTRRAAAE